MNVIDDIIASIREDSTVNDIRACVFWTAVVSRHCGLASTIRDDAMHHARVSVTEAGSLLDKTALDLARLAHSDSLPEASIGMAAINSLIDIDVNRCTEQNAFEILRKKGTGKNVAIIGHFPFVSRLRDLAKILWVLEKHPAGGDLSEEQAAHILPQADVVGITGTTLINHSFEHLISLCRNKFVVLLGPSTPLTPVLFDYGIDVLSGVLVTERQTVLNMISQGASFKQIKGVKLLTMAAGKD